MPVVAARSPADAFECAIEACRIAVQYMTPVMLLTDGYIANAAEPWKVPDPETFEPFPVQFLTDKNSEGSDGEAALLPYKRDESGKRPWIKPGTPGLMHRIGGIEKDALTGNISYDPANHQHMTDVRKAKIDGVSVPDQEVCLGNDSGRLVLVGWGSTYGPIHQAVRRARKRGLDVSHVHVRHVWPLPKNLGPLLKGFDKVLVPEMNTGQFVKLLRSEYLVPAESLSKVAGQPFKIGEILAAIQEALADSKGSAGAPAAIGENS